jgi:hypothetical protein
MILRHQCERARADDAFAVELTAAPQHLAEPQVVCGRACEATAARQERRLRQIRALERVVDAL